MNKYVYAIINKPQSIVTTITGLENYPVYLLTVGSLSAVISDTEQTHYAISREQALTHEQVISKLMETYPAVLPVSFGTIAQNSSQIQEIVLRDQEEVLKKTLKIIEGKIQIGIQGIWINMNLAISEVLKDYPTINKLRWSPSSNPFDLEAMIDIGKAVEEKLNQKKDIVKEKLVSKLKNTFEAYKETSIFSDDLLFSLVFRISRRKEHLFYEKISALDKVLRKSHITLKYTRPSPLFDFDHLPISINLAQKIKVK